VKWIALLPAVLLAGCVPTSYDPADAAKRCRAHGGLDRVESHDAGGWTQDGEGYCNDGTMIVYRGWSTEVVEAKP
jgi:hypothetical protein